MIFQSLFYMRKKEVLMLTESFIFDKESGSDGGGGGMEEG